MFSIWDFSDILGICLMIAFFCMPGCWRVLTIEFNNSDIIDPMHNKRAKNLSDRNSVKIWIKWIASDNISSTISPQKYTQSRTTPEMIEFNSLQMRAVPAKFRKIKKKMSELFGRIKIIVIILSHKSVLVKNVALLKGCYTFA